MPTRISRSKIRLGDAQNTEHSNRSSSLRLDRQTDSFTDDQVDKMSIRLQNTLNHKMREEIKKSENDILKALFPCERTP